MATKAYSNTFKSLPKVTQVDKAALSGVQVDYNLEAYYIYDLAKYLNAQWITTGCLRPVKVNFKYFKKDLIKESKQN